MERVALITGGANGIGLACAWAFGRAGARVAIADREEDALACAAKELASENIVNLTIPCDVSQEADCRAMVSAVEGRFGRLDHAVNAAGIAGGGPDRARTADYATETWSRVIGINLTGVFLSAKFQIPLILRSGGGAIVNISSIMGFRGGPEIPAYTAAKHGVLGLTKTIADEYGGQGLRCNAVAPGMVQTRLTARYDDDPTLMEQAVRAIPQGRFASPDEIAAAVIWLCGDGASFVNGTCLTVDGGQLIRV